jgi:hypothetical protein
MCSVIVKRAELMIFAVFFLCALGIGEFICQDNRYYKGQWKEGKRNGRATQSALRSGAGGHPKRLFIGGVGSLYRFRLHEGQWLDDIRTGHGECYIVLCSIALLTFYCVALLCMLCFVLKWKWIPHRSMVYQ